MRLILNGDDCVDVIDYVFCYGEFNDWVLVGDWNGDGIWMIGVFCEGVWKLDIDGDGCWIERDELV